MKAIYFSIFIFITFTATSQTMDSTQTPYHQIPNYPSKVTSGAIISRMIDGLGFRFYWASKDLRDVDLSYKPSEDGKSTMETLGHVYDLAESINNVAQGLPNIRPYKKHEMNYEEMRKKTLLLFKEASESFLIKNETDVEAVKVVFQRGEELSEYPIFNFINGQLTDAIYHTGQIVSFRRSSGNSIQKGVNVFMGKTAE